MLVRFSFDGHPATIENGGTSNFLLTSDFAATTMLEGMMLPLCMLQLCAIHTRLPITIGSNWLMYPTSHDRECGKLVSVLLFRLIIEWKSVSQIIQFQPIRTSSPIVILL